MATQTSAEKEAETAAELEKTVSDNLRVVRQAEARREQEEAKNSLLNDNLERSTPPAADKQKTREQLAEEYQGRTYKETTAQGRVERVEVKDLVENQLRGNDRTKQAIEYNELKGAGTSQEKEYKGKEQVDLKQAYKDARDQIRGSGENQKDDFQLAKDNEFKRTNRLKKVEEFVVKDDDSGKETKYVREANRINPANSRTQELEKITSKDADGKDVEKFQLKREVVGRDDGAKREFEYGERGKINIGGKEKDYREVTVSKFDKDGKLRERYEAKQIIEIDKDGVEKPANNRASPEERDVKMLDKVDRRGRVVLETKEADDGERQVTRVDRNLLSTRKTVNLESDTTNAKGEKLTVGTTVEKEITGIRGKYNYKLETTDDGTVETRKRESSIGPLNYTKEKRAMVEQTEAGDTKTTVIEKTDRGTVGTLIKGSGTKTKEEINLSGIKAMSEQDVQDKALAFYKTSALAKKLPSNKAANEMADEDYQALKQTAKTHAMAFPDKSLTPQENRERVVNAALTGAKEKYSPDEAETIKSLKTERPQQMKMVEEEVNRTRDDKIEKLAAIKMTQEELAKGKIQVTGTSAKELDERLQDTYKKTLDEAQFADEQGIGRTEKKQRDADQKSGQALTIEEQVTQKVAAGREEALSEDLREKQKVQIETKRVEVKNWTDVGGGVAYATQYLNPNSAPNKADRNLQKATEALNEVTGDAKAAEEVKKQVKAEMGVSENGATDRDDRDPAKAMAAYIANDKNDRRPDLSELPDNPRVNEQTNASNDKALASNKSSRDGNDASAGGTETTSSSTVSSLSDDEMSDVRRITENNIAELDETVSNARDENRNFKELMDRFSLDDNERSRSNNTHSIT